MLLNLIAVEIVEVFLSSGV